jgi:3-hydroxyacyl-[acyl-carrier-protein] dehydratase
MDPDKVYKIATSSSQGDELKATVIFNAKHPLFKGHFPVNPVVPGVVQVQIIKELAEMHEGKKLLLRHAKNIKFLSLISPVVNPKAEVTLHFGTMEANYYSVQASIRAGETVFMKFSGIFRPASRL